MVGQARVLVGLRACNMHRDPSARLLGGRRRLPPRRTPCPMPKWKSTWSCCAWCAKAMPHWARPNEGLWMRWWPCV